jgi:hypothetical protein
MKKYLHLLIALAIVLSMVFSLAVPASAATLTASLKGAEEEVENTENTEEEEPPEVTDSDEPYPHTQQFLDVMEAKGYGDLCTYEGRDDDNDDAVRIDDYIIVDGEEYDVPIIVFFEEDNETISFYIWNLIDFNEEDIGDIYRLVSSFNYDWHFCKFYVDETDYSVTEQLDMIVDADQDISNAAAFAYDALVYIAESVAPDLIPYAK